MYAKSWKTDTTPPRSDILSVAISQSEEDLVIVTANSEIIFVQLENLIAHIEAETKLQGVLEPEDVSGWKITPAETRFQVALLG